MRVIPRLTMRSRLQGIVDDLQLAHDWKLSELFAQLAAQRKARLNRLLTVQVLPHGSLPAKTCALWVATPPRGNQLGVDILLHERTGEEQYARQLLGHELGHLFCDDEFQTHPLGFTNRPRRRRRTTGQRDGSQHGLTPAEMRPLLDTVNDTLGSAVGEINESMVKAHRGTSGYDEKIEQRAEFFGTLLSVRAWPEDAKRRSLEFAAFALNTPFDAPQLHVGG